MKKYTSKLLLLLVLMGALILLSACGNDQSTPADESGAGENAAEPITIRIAHESEVQHPVNIALEEFKEKVEAETDGRISVEIFPASQMGNAQANIELTRRGDIEMTLNATTHYVQSIPEFAIWESFFLFDDEEHAHRVLDGKAGQELMKPLEPMGLVGIGYMEMGFRNFSNSKGPINTVDDLKGLTIRGYNPIMMKAWNSVGVQTTSLTWAEVFTALQQGLIDGQECSTVSFLNAKFYEVNKYWTLTKHIYTNYLWFANKEFMDSLSEADRAIIDEAAKGAIAYQREMMKADEEEILNTLRESGVEINEMPLEERRKLAATIDSAIKEDIIAQCGQDIYDMVMAEVEAERL